MISARCCLLLAMYTIAPHGSVCTDIVHLHEMNLKYYGHGVDRFREMLGQASPASFFLSAPRSFLVEEFSERAHSRLMYPPTKLGRFAIPVRPIFADLNPDWCRSCSCHAA